MVSVGGNASTVAKRKTGLGRFAAWVGVLALGLQILLPLAPAQAALPVDMDLAVSICHSGAPDAAPASGMVAHDHCQFCQIHASAKLLLPALSWDMPSTPAMLFIVLPPSDRGAEGNPGHLPHPQRGPPSFS